MNRQQQIDYVMKLTGCDTDFAECVLFILSGEGGTLKDTEHIFTILRECRKEEVVYMAMSEKERTREERENEAELIGPELDRW